VSESSAKAFIICTELGVCHSIRRRCPEKRIVEISSLADCPNMKLNTLEKIAWALEDLEVRVEVPEDVAGGARQAIERMLALA
jgi:quinolinate synthase